LRAEKDGRPTDVAGGENVGGLLGGLEIAQPGAGVVEESPGLSRQRPRKIERDVEARGAHFREVKQAGQLN